MDFHREYDRCKAAVEAALSEYFTDCCPQKGLLESMRYSLLAGGKRVRPVLVLQFCQAAGGEMDKALPFACAIEMLHTYSLIHDDLPCMDNDDQRRGKPTNHKVYGECVATLAGDALQASAFRTVLAAPLPGELRAQAGKVLAEAAGELGMCGGQYLDTVPTTISHTRADIEQIHTMKTGALLRAACEMGVWAANGTAEMRLAAATYGEALGRAFQIRDDLLDVTSTTEQLGKPVGSDARQGKTTFATLLGIEKSETLILQETERAKSALIGVFQDSSFLCALADSLATRKK